jgi:flagellar motor switch protein FliM
LAKVRRDGAFDRGEGRWTLARLESDGGGRCRSLGGRERKVDAGPRVAADPMSDPYASLPITLTAVLVDMAIPFSKLASLRPGDVLPVAVARAVPLKAGERVIATGTIGEYEDRVAVQISNAFSN